MLPATSDPFLLLQEALKGRYSLERELGRGGMGIVYLAHEVALNRPVALKLLPPPVAAKPTRRERFLREARTAARLSHPNIVPIHTVDQVGGFVFFTMAYVDGETLRHRVRSRGPLPSAEAARVLRDVAGARAPGAPRIRERLLRRRWRVARVARARGHAAGGLKSANVRAHAVRPSDHLL